MTQSQGRLACLAPRNCWSTSYQRSQIERALKQSAHTVQKQFFESSDPELKEGEQRLTANWRGHTGA